MSFVFDVDFFTGVFGDLKTPVKSTIELPGVENILKFFENHISAMSRANTSSETQGQIKGARKSLNGRKNIYGTKKSRERREEPLGTMSYQTSSKRSPPFWLLIGARKTQIFWHQSEARTAATVWNWSGKTLSPGAFLAVLYFSSCHIFFRWFRLFLVPTICPWVSEDGANIVVSNFKI